MNNVNLNTLNKDIEKIREKVESYEVIASSFDNDFQRQRDDWMKKSELANRVLVYLMALREFLVEREDDGK